MIGKTLLSESDVRSNVELDIALALPWMSCLEQRRLMKQQQGEGEDKYKGEKLPGGYSSSVVPLAFEHFEHWGEEALNYLNQLSKMLRNDYGRFNACNFKTHWRRRFSIQLQCCNTSVLSREISHITGGQQTSQGLGCILFCAH